MKVKERLTNSLKMQYTDIINFSKNRHKTFNCILFVVGFVVDYTESDI